MVRCGACRLPKTFDGTHPTHPPVSLVVRPRPEDVSAGRQERSAEHRCLGEESAQAGGPRQERAEEREQQQLQQVEVLGVPGRGLVVVEEDAEDGVGRWGRGKVG